MKLAKALNDKMMDVRLVDRLLAQGKITKAEFDKYIGGLDDEQANSMNISDERKIPAASTTEQ